MNEIIIIIMQKKPTINPSDKYIYTILIHFTITITHTHKKKHQESYCLLQRIVFVIDSIVGYNDVNDERNPRDSQKK